MVTEVDAETIRADGTKEQVKDQTVEIQYNDAIAAGLLASAGEAGRAIAGKSTTMTIIYACGDFTSATNVVRSDDKVAKLKISRNASLPSTGVDAFFKNPFADLKASRGADLKILNALITPVPSTANGWTIAVCIFVFIGFFAVGPGVCVWLALSELMPTRIRSNGMSIALLVNQVVSTTIAAIFLPTVGKYGYGTMFFAFAACTVIYFITAAFFLPETKGKTLEEIEEHFEGKNKA
jgi:phage shock protein PspC (stress-responsive transcriptional regulator)